MRCSRISTSPATSPSGSGRRGRPAGAALAGPWCLVVAPDRERALGLTSRSALMHRGRLGQIGRPAEIYERPASRLVADFVGAVNLFEGTLVASFNTLRLAIPDAGASAPLPQ